MFTGLVEALAKVIEVRLTPPGKRLIIRAAEIADALRIGDSIAVSGCCLTVVEIGEDKDGSASLTFEAGPETLSRTILNRLVAGEHVNLERSMRLADRLGGHLVTGHVDGVGTLVGRIDEGPWSTLRFRVPEPLMPQIASKGSIAVDGVSLTVVDVNQPRFEFNVALIPHTLEATTLGRLAVADQVNIETDLIAKYVERQMQGK